MTITAVVVAVALVAAVAAFAASMSRHHHDPLDTVGAERALRRQIWRHPRVLRFVRQRLDRTSAGGLLLTVAFGIVFVIAAGLGLLVDLVDENARVASIDASVSEWGSRNASSDAATVLKAVTQLGSTVVVFVVLVVVAAIDYRRRKSRSVFAFLAIVLGGELILNNALKVIVGRDRPSVLRLVGASGLSFPSGHTAAAAAGWSAAALVLSRDRARPVRALAASIAVLVAAAVGTSRALLGVHWVTDVVGGLLLGWGWFFLVAVSFGGRRQELGSSVSAETVATAGDAIVRPLADQRPIGTTR